MPRFGKILWLVPALLLAQTPSIDLRNLENELAAVRDVEAVIYAPGRYAEALRAYGEVDTLQRRLASPEAIRTAADRARGLLEQSRRSAVQIKRDLDALIQTRTGVLELSPSIEAQTGKADQYFRQAIALAEAGDSAGAQSSAGQAIDAYNSSAVVYFRQSKMPEARRQLESARGQVPQQTLEQALSALSSLDQQLTGRFDSVALSRRIDQIVGSVFGPLFRRPPMTLHLGDFTLFVEAYESYSWNFLTTQFVRAKGTARLSFNCAPVFPWPWLFSGIATQRKPFRVVEAVRDPLTEISLEKARTVDPATGLNSTLELKIPAYAISSKQVISVIDDLGKYGVKPRGEIRVAFDNLTIQPGPLDGEGLVLAGSATYPTTPPEPDPITLDVAGFRLFITKLSISTTGAVATGELELPRSIIDSGSGHPGRVPLGDFAITSSCSFHKSLPSAAFGPWAVGNTEVEIKGTGIVVDFDKVWAPPGLSPSSPANNAVWRGVILQTGNTIPATADIVSNSGYLRAAYKFANAEVSSPGLRGAFQLTAKFTFTSLEPYAYTVELREGSLNLANSAVASAQFIRGGLRAPGSAAHNQLNFAVLADYQLMNVDANLDLLSDAAVTGPIRWGEFTKTASSPRFYEAQGFTRARFYLAGVYRANYFPVDPAGDFQQPNVLNDLRPQGLQGLTVAFPASLVINTPDTPGPRVLKFRAQGDMPVNWLNISFGGVHGSMSGVVFEPGTPKAQREVGPTYKNFYVGKEPFRPASTIGLSAPVEIINEYHLAIKFVSSAVYDCDMSGTFHIPAPVNSDLDFANLAFTSTAQISGAKAPFTTPFKLDYWGLEMVKKPGAAAGAVISVRTGQVFFTAAGIREPQHFLAPFYLTWGEMLANGQLKRLVFDYSGVGQKFDRFPFTTSFVRLSEYDAANPSAPAFLKVAGTAHFDFFGPKYINLNDVYDPAKTAPPFNKRNIDSLQTDSDPGGLYRASDPTIAGKWSDDFGAMNYAYNYDKKAQDGFVGTGKMSFLWITGDMNSTIVLKAERACMSLNETTNRDLNLGPVAQFGSMTRITGCGCIEGGQLQRVVLSAELENTAGSNIMLRSAAYGRVDMSLSPSVSSIGFEGDMFATVLVAGNIEITGRAAFTVNRDQDFVDGEFDGSIDAGTALGLGTLKGDGQLNWHLGTVGGSSYHSLQGRLAVKVVAPGAGIDAEGGFYVGRNAPKSEAWVLMSGGDHFKLDMAPLPDRLTGVYGFAKVSEGLSVWVISGGYDAYVGLGGFVLSPQQVINLNAKSSGLPVGGLPFVVGNVGLRVWGEILGGFVSASGSVDLNVIAPYPFSFQGTLELEGCVVWVACKSVDLNVGLTTADGLFVR